MKPLLLLGLLCVLAGPLRAQPQLAQRTDTTAAPVWVPVPTAVLAACQRVAPELAADPKMVWTTCCIDEFALSSERTRICEHRDTLTYTLSAYFDSTSLIEFAREVSADTLRPAVRRVVQRLQRRYAGSGQVLPGLCIFKKHGFRLARKQHFMYTFWVHNADNPAPLDVYSFWGNGRLALRNGQPVWHKRRMERSTRSVHI